VCITVEHIYTENGLCISVLVFSHKELESRDETATLFFFLSLSYRCCFLLLSLLAAFSLFFLRFAGCSSFPSSHTRGGVVELDGVSMVVGLHIVKKRGEEKMSMWWWCVCVSVYEDSQEERTREKES